ncbi:helicase-associated domain-containing protein [Cryptosporangium sp. NPDC048952]|uniref:helicase-associated domain-containing protein n=1 Tax=Cryptosporangium sp. NPDC048952 TaxID=3363961 RepID=UPI0037137540
MDHLVAHVRGLDRDALAALIAARPDAAAWPEPRTLTDLAQRLGAVHSVQRALGRVNRAGLQVAEAMAALGGVATEERLSQLLDVDDVELFAETLATLSALALVVRAEDGSLVLVAPLRLLAEPLGLGVRLGGVLPLLTIDRLRAIAQLWVPSPARRKDDVVEQVLAAVADPARVREVVAGLPPDVRELLHGLAWNGPRAATFDRSYHWCVERGLLTQISWDYVELPGEIGLALRGPDYRAPFSVPQPSPVSGVVSAEDLIAAGTAAVTQTLADTERLLEFCERTPLATTKAGRVTVRETKRAEKAVGGAFGALLPVVLAAGLLGTSEGDVTLTERADAWRDAEPASRLATLAAGWWESPDDVVLRHRLVSYLASLPEGARADDVDAVAAVLSWRHPIAVAPTPVDQETVAARAAVALSEAERFGAVALGAATPVAHVLASGVLDGLVAAAGVLVPEPVAVVTFQSDLSAVVGGVPAGWLAALLDGVAEREAAGAASIWRFSPAGVRGALDRGVDADALLAELAQVATGDLPQALEYLVRDVARRHGHVRVAPAASVVCADDEALLAELVAMKSLQALRLRAVAPTVLVSAADPDETLAALRAAGYAPTGLTEGGGAMVERQVRRRASAPQPWTPHSENPPPDAEALTDRLLSAQEATATAATATAATATAAAARDAAADPAARRAAARGSAARESADPWVGAPRTAAEARADLAARHPDLVVSRQTDTLTPHEREILLDAIETGAAIRIDYVSATGRNTSRVIEKAELTGDAVIAWCHLRTAERMFVLSRIQGVEPA